MTTRSGDYGGKAGHAHGSDAVLLTQPKGSRRRRVRLSAAAKARWFQRGAAALASVLPERAGAGYACPLCLRASTDIRLFTAEDVPPHRVGGRPLVLTRKGCNDFGGHQLDWHWGSALDVSAFLEGDLTEPRMVRFHCGDIATTVAITSVGRNVDVRVVDQASDKKAVAGQQDVFRSYQQENPPTLRLEFHKSKFSERRLRASVLRAGYLMGFALTGYRFLGLWNPIREHIRDPDERRLPRLVIYNGEHSSSRRVLALVREPADCRSILVGFGKWTALLPLTTGSRLFEPLLARESYSFQATGLEWPTEPTFGVSSGA